MPLDSIVLLAFLTCPAQVQWQAGLEPAAHSERHDGRLQLVDKRGIKGHDLTRTGRMALYGGLVFGPVATTWFGFLARRVNFSNRRVETLARVACDQTLFAPVMIGVFLSSMATMEGASPKERLARTWWPALQTNWMVWPFVQMINFTFLPLQHRVLFANAAMEGPSPKERLARTWWPALQTNWMVWPFVQMINFTFLPLQHRVLFANVISIGWNCYLSWVNSQTPATEVRETRGEKERERA
ncbi:Mpv17/PMP22 [Ophiocordyceps sinensis CO18]|uniref:Mpv17/PMP22 n=1 Tax=Ophiocordyceps sinensis (strain Co18 / CGMCC 3.14243) TaxID=911162 RepID=T5A4E4_OPHSC|nr:Mpv17/PMP22 [Ophiocordyceps sinensis CO18]